jgi:hypothetical protein
LGSLADEVLEFFDSHPCDTEHTRDLDSGEERFVVRDIPELPPSWGFEVGEACGLARSSLDHLVYLLAKKNGGNPDSHRTQFPIVEPEKRCPAGYDG